jgi:hypothetical protein
MEKKFLFPKFRKKNFWKKKINFGKKNFENFEKIMANIPFPALSGQICHFWQNSALITFKLSIRWR